MPNDYELLTYKELTDRLGIKMTSVRQTVSRRRWRRLKQNDGSVKIEVPLSYLQRDIIPVDVKVDVDMSVEISKLTAENHYLKQRISDLEVDRDRWHTLALRPWWKRLTG